MACECSKRKKLTQAQMDAKLQEAQRKRNEEAAKAAAKPS
jgi:hypothetical protein